MRTDAQLHVWEADRPDQSVRFGATTRAPGHAHDARDHGPLGGVKVDVRPRGAGHVRDAFLPTPEHLDRMRR